MKLVLSIQSHVAHGYVGNRAATFPLQARGWDVDEIHTVNYSNHTGYGLGNVFGQKSTAQEIGEVYKGLKNLNFEYDGILTGYTPNAQTLSEVKRIGLDVKSRFPKALWVLDPVMGDGGQLYVDADVVPVYKEILETGQVDVITPNQFEAELLSGIKIVDVESVKKAVSMLHHKYKIPNVVITSCVFDKECNMSEESEECGDGASRLFCFVSQADCAEVFCLETPMLQGYFTGTGDLFAAMILDGLQRYEGERSRHLKHRENELVNFEQWSFPLLNAAKDTMAIVHGVLERTLAFAKNRGHTYEGGIKGNAATMRDMELRVVDSLNVFCDTGLQGSSVFQCTKV